MWRIIRRLTDTGVTILLTTHYLEEADQLADRIAVVDGGHVVAEGTPAELKERVAARRLDLTLSSPGAFAAMADRLGDRTVRTDPDTLVIGVATDGSAGHIRALLDEVDPDRRAVSTFAVHTATLDDVFLALTGHHATAVEKETAGV